MTHALRARLGLLAGMAATVAGVALTHPVSTQAPSRPPGADYTGRAFNFVKIADDVYHAVGTSALTVGCNGAVVVNDSDVLVVDSHISPAAAWALREELKTVTPKPIRFVVNTHFHFDHAHGNEIYGRDVEIIGHEFTRAQLASGASKTGRSHAFFVGTLPAQIDQLEKRIAAAADPAERAKLEAQLAVMKRHYVATQAVSPTPPTVTLTETLTLYRGGREIRLLHLGRGHTGGDVVVHLPKERLVVTGDLLTAGPSYLGDGYFTEWIATLEKLRAVDFDTVLPGHGDAFKGKAKIDHFQAYLRDFWTQAQQQHKARVAAEEAARRIDLRAQSANYPAITQAGVNVNGVLRAYELLDGKVQ
jgi:glyoxylase-like metal-dependent hydrolase (beta-lactamase superfamily II)